MEMARYLASEPQGSAQRIWVKFQRMHPNRSVGGWRAHYTDKKGLIDGIARQLKAQDVLPLSPRVRFPVRMSGGLHCSLRRGMLVH
ncbi:hypothetical protein BS47DRAFT_1216679 [Hydnum rufescens UP504]|uniref:Uncharacterized protein n=1 Tax=Hydnum rufescens UP504 TaxID=1448309 RepID=A0A9P6DQD8_9AGAM|nr:hypothetical protein BS47DRAFT_1216679 [Hydnum rufescens UP504]